MLRQIRLGFDGAQVFNLTTLLLSKTHQRMISAAYHNLLAFSDLLDVCSAFNESYSIRTISRLEERYRLWYYGLDDLLNAAEDERKVLLEGTQSLLAELAKNLAQCKS